MNSEIIIIAIIVFLSVGCLCLGILNWIQLVRTSSKIIALETEIDKKTKEFDTLKKERQQYVQAATPDSLQQSENPPIEIVRNFRPGFQNSQEVNQPFSDKSPLFQATIEKPSAYGKDGFTHVSPLSSQPQWSEAPTVGALAADSPSGENTDVQTTDVLEILEENAPKEDREHSRDAAIIIELYSAIKKDTDFSSAWKQLSSQLPTTPTPRVVLDFKNVMFLYGKELIYLEKIRDVILSQRGRLELVHCHAELRTILCRRPSLAEFIT